MLRDLFAHLDREGREVVERTEHSTRIEDLEALYAGGSQVDPLIARPLDQLPLPLSSGDKAVFILDGRHRLFAAAAQDIDELEAYVVVKPLL